MNQAGKNIIIRSFDSLVIVHLCIGVPVRRPNYSQILSVMPSERAGVGKKSTKGPGSVCRHLGGKKAFDVMGKEGSPVGSRKGQKRNRLCLSSSLLISLHSPDSSCFPRCQDRPDPPRCQDAKRERISPRVAALCSLCNSIEVCTGVLVV